MKSKLPLYAFVFAFSVFFLTGCTSKENISISEGFSSEGQALYQEREYLKATEKFMEALEKYPQNTQAYFGLTNIFVDKGFLKEAADLAKESSMRISKDDSAEIYSLVGIAYYETKDLEKAKEMYEKALGQHRKYPKAKLGLAAILIQEGEFKEAQKTLRGSDEDSEVSLLYAYLTLDKWEDGEFIVKNSKIDEIQDEELKSRFLRLKEIYEINDEDALYKNTSLAGEYIKSGYPALAIRLLLEQDEGVEEYPEAQYFLGRSYLEMEEYEKAIEKLNAALLLDFDDVDAKIALAIAYLFNKNIEKSIDSYKTALASINPEDSEYLVEEYVVVLVENNMINSAITLLNEMLLEKNIFHLNMILAEIYHKQGDFNKMIVIIEKLDTQANLTQAETRDLTRIKLLHTTENIEDAEDVEALIDRFVVFDKYNPEIFLFKGKLALHRKDNDGARESLERAIDLDLSGDIVEKASKLLATID